MGKYWTTKNLGNLVNDAQFVEILLTNTHKYSETTEDSSSDSPKYFSPFALSTVISQNFTTPIFSTYGICVEANCHKYFSQGILYALGE